jgi:hypothetical protein
MSRPTYVGRLVAVELDGGEHVDVSPRALGVLEGRGIVTARSRPELEARQLDKRPESPVWWPLARIFYHRRRPEGDRWQHETPGAYVALGDGPRPAAFIEAAGAYRCNRPGDFICGA